MPLDLLPIELQCSFTRLLDPIGLISLSQTSKHFRHLIKPAKEHFVERLLKLETLEEYGGPTPCVDPTIVDCMLDYGQVERNDIRWACTGCLGLLPRRCFNNRSILDFDYQKPMRSSPQLDEPTSWEPLAVTDSKTKAEEGKTKEEGETREEWISLQLDPLEEWPLLLPDADESANKLSGNNRQNRRCLECQYQRGELRPLSDGLGGNAKVPVQANRPATFYSDLDRYFPGISNYLGFEFPPAVENMNLLLTTPLNPLTQAEPIEQLMRMVRCPRCTRWKELRDFRLQIGHLRGTRYQEEGGIRYYVSDDEYCENMDALLKDACCNACFAKANGRLELGRALGSWFRKLVDSRLRQVSRHLKKHARSIPWHMTYIEGVELTERVEGLEETVPCLSKRHDSVLNEEEIAQLKTYRAHAICMWEQQYKDKDWRRHKITPPCVSTWAWSHKLYEDVLRDLKTCKEKLGEQPEVFAAWALDRDESTWDYEVEGALIRERERLWTERDYEGLASMGLGC
ncbi:hypothetical protein CDV31_009190 [Fusarium ambrosium]|uniref:F-box domain-containing protein n=1 Tax=Fusarium ambrosium TaxID=131363 RepID=A0A428TWL7_9HYPO|nr:hypothetical protein CDV31_009190 [Fusarium ambrosium]